MGIKKRIFISMTDVNNIFSLFYGNDPELLEMVITHSRCVADKALNCARRHNIDIDAEFVWQAAMLHDIGVVRCSAPSILCHGTLPYICHGIEGRKMLESLGMPRHALVCERHTGSGLSKDDIIRQNLPLPHRDMLPISSEEKLVCYADKFFSKSRNLSEEKPIQLVINQMKSFGEDSLERFMALHELFG